MRRVPGSPGGNSTTMVIACAPAGMNGGSASCTTVIADCHAFDSWLLTRPSSTRRPVWNSPPRQVTRAGYEASPSTYAHTVGHDRPHPKVQEEGQ